MAVISLSVDDEHASLALRESVALDEAVIPKVLRSLVSHRNISAAVVTSTCMRTLIVVESDRFHGAIDEITDTLCEITTLAPEDFQDALTIHFDRGVANHLFAVAAGLKSVVPGEYEILGQLRRALDRAQEEHVASPALVELFQRAITSGRRVRNETTIARGTTSFAHAAVTSALAHDTNSDHRAVVVGAGQLATGIVRSLLGSDRVSEIVVVNRTLARATELVAQVDAAQIRVSELDGLHDHVAQASMVFVAANVPAPILTTAQLAQRTSPLLAVDLAMPHGIERHVDQLDAITRIDIDSLKVQVDRALDDRRDAIAAAEEIVRLDVEKFLDDQRARGAAALVTELREHFDDIVERELERRASDLEGLTGEQIDVLRSVVRSVVAKIAHRPTTALKESAGTDHGARLSDATRQLFDLS